MVLIWGLSIRKCLISNLHGKLVAGVAASIDDVEAGHWHEDVLHLRRKMRERKSLGASGGCVLPQQGRQCDGREELPCELRQPVNPW